MKPILSFKELTIPEGVEVTVKSRRFTVTGPRGKLTKDLSHIAADMYLVEDAEAGTKKLKVEIHFSSRKGLSSLRTVISHIQNMITGVTLGYKCVFGPSREMQPGMAFGGMLLACCRPAAHMAHTDCQKTISFCWLPFWGDVLSW